MNPAPKVSWFEWGDAAFEKALAEDKPIVLAIGATWCHGCRVMDEKTYGDGEVAEVLNRDYVPVRIDSDRRPDVNERYNLGGWPTTAFLTPRGELMGGTTYVDRDQMVQLLAQLKVGFSTHRDQIDEEIARREEKIAQVLKPPGASPPVLDMEILRKTINGITATFDEIHAGFGKAPRFPMVASLRVILQALHETQGPDFESILTRTLDAMGDRGMYDAMDGGFFHYVTNEVWSTPRFEKMCEDNAGLIRLYLDASLVTGQKKYRERAVHALQWVESVLWDEGRSAFRASQYADEPYYLSLPKARAKKDRPSVDDAVITPSCAAMAAAFLRAAEVLDDPSLEARGLGALDFLLRECVGKKGVAHVHDGAPGVFALARDRIVLGSALLDAYDHTGDEARLEAAESVTAPLMTHFWSDAEKGLVDRAVDAIDRGELVRQKRSMADNGLAAENFARLGRIRRSREPLATAEKIILSFPDMLDGYGHPSAEYALAADWLVRPPVEVHAGSDALRPFVPRRVVRREGS